MDSELFEESKKKRDNKFYDDLKKGVKRGEL